MTETLANVLLFNPGGVFLAIALQRHRTWWFAAMLSILFSLCIEMAQGMMRGGRSADSTDVILNAVGAVLGYIVCQAWMKSWPNAKKESVDLMS